MVPIRVSATGIGIKMANYALPYEHRRTMRLDVCFNAGLREPGSAHKFEVDVIDLSMTGCRFETSFTIKPGRMVFFSIPGMNTLEATIHWSRGFIYGAQFDQPLNAAVFDFIAARYLKA